MSNTYQMIRVIHDDGHRLERHTMANGKFVAYYRVSTKQQGASGLGMDAQREAIRLHLANGGFPPIAEFQDIESGKNDKRPGIVAAIRHCQKTGATLIIAKLDRLARNVHFLHILDDAKVEFVACDMPHANRFSLTIMLAVAEQEAAWISTRTKAALAAAKARGTVLGGYKGAPAPDWVAGHAAKQVKADEFAERIYQDLVTMQSRGLSLREMAQELTERRIQTRRDGVWTATTVRRVLLRGGAL